MIQFKCKGRKKRVLTGGHSGKRCSSFSKEGRLLFYSGFQLIRSTHIREGQFSLFSKMLITSKNTLRMHPEKGPVKLTHKTNCGIFTVKLSINLAFVDYNY